MSTGISTLETPATIARPGMLLPAVVGFYFSFRLLSVLFAVHVLNADPQIGTGLSLGLNFLLLGMAVFHSFGPTSRTLAFILRLPCFFWILFFLGFSGCSLAWSVTASLPAAAAFWCAMAADLAIVVLLLRTGPTLETTSTIMAGYVWGSCGVALIAWIMPAQSDYRLGDDEFIGPNQIGYTCAFGALLAQYLVRNRQLRWKLAAGFLAITMLRSLSKTTIIAYVMAQAFILFSDKAMSRKTKWTLVLGVIAVVALFWGLLQNYFDVYTNAGNQSETLTGRIGIWGYILNEAVDRPWLGHGFNSVAKVIPPFGRDQFETRHAHNELLQQFYAYGVVGVVMLIGLYTSFYRWARKLPKSPLRTFFVGMVIFVIVRGFADTEVFDLSLPLWAVAMFSAIIAETIPNCWPITRPNTI